MGGEPNEPPTKALVSAERKPMTSINKVSAAALAVIFGSALLFLSVALDPARAEEGSNSDVPAALTPDSSAEKDSDGAVDAAVCTDALVDGKLDVGKFRSTVAARIPALSNARFSDSADGIILTAGKYQMEFVLSGSVMQLSAPIDLPQELLTAAVMIADEVKYEC